MEEGGEESCNRRKRGGRGVVDGATTAFEEGEDVGFVLGKEFVGRVERLSAKKCLKFGFGLVDDFVDGGGHVEFNVDCRSE